MELACTVSARKLPKSKGMVKAYFIRQQGSSVAAGCAESQSARKKRLVGVGAVGRPAELLLVPGAAQGADDGLPRQDGRPVGQLRAEEPPFGRAAPPHGGAQLGVGQPPGHAVNADVESKVSQNDKNTDRPALEPTDERRTHMASESPPMKSLRAFLALRWQAEWSAWQARVVTLTRRLAC